MGHSQGRQGEYGVRSSAGPGEQKTWIHLDLTEVLLVPRRLPLQQHH